MKMNVNEGQFFSSDLLAEIRSKFHYITEDPLRPGQRIYFDNAGGSFRLKSALEVFYFLDSLPDCPERVHQTAVYLNRVMADGEQDMRIIFGAQKEGRVIPMLAASQVIYVLTGTIVENVPGKNVVTTALEHPCAFDAARFFSEKTGKEFRVAKTNKVTGGVDPEEIAKLIDNDTCLLSVIFASNISGSVLNIKKIVDICRAIKPDLYIICDSVQHAPHGIIDVDSLHLDGAFFAPYKFFGVRGSGIGYASDRVSKLPHPRLLGKDAMTWNLGSPAPGHYAVITKIVDYVCWLGDKNKVSADRRAQFIDGMNQIKLQERALMNYMLQGLRKISGVKIHLDHPDMTSRDFIVAIEIAKWGFTEVVREYERRGVVVFERVNTSIYSKRMLESFGMEGAIRVSPHHCTSIEEIDKFLAITGEIAKMH
jgi:selenocysteine lyase/cysteine desulfurase